MKKISIILGSTEKDCCDILCNNYVNCLSFNYDVEVITLRDFNIPHCLNCEMCHAKRDGVCHKNKSEIDEVIKNLIDNDLTIIISPAKFFNFNGLTKLFLDRTYPHIHNTAFANKKFAFVFVGYTYGVKEIEKYCSYSISGFILDHSIDNIGVYSYRIDKNKDWKEETMAYNFMNEKDRDDMTMKLIHHIREILPE